MSATTASSTVTITDDVRRGLSAVASGHLLRHAPRPVATGSGAVEQP